MNWLDFEGSVHRLADRIDYQPDSIVAVIRGGLVPARLLGRRFSNADVDAIRVNKHNDDRQVVGTTIGEIAGRNILVVEDVLETGLSLQAAAEYFKNRGATVKTASLFVTEHSITKPDYFVETVPSAPPLPWELT